MKLALIFLAVVSAAFAAPSGKVAPFSDLRPALDRLLENVDQEGLTALLPTLVESPEGQKVLEYLRGEDFDGVLDALYREPEFVKLLDYLFNNGLVHIYEYIDALHVAIGIPPREHSSKSVQPRELQDLIDLVLALIDVNGLLEDLLDLVSVDVAVQELLEVLAAPEVAAAYQRIKADPKCVDLVDRLRGYFPEIDTLLALVEAILGWGRKAVAPHADDLSQALAQLLENVDQEGLLALLPTLVESPEGQRVLEYLRGDDFAAILDALYAEPEFNNILNYLATNGLEGIYDAIDALHEAIGIDRKMPYIRHGQPRELQDLIDQVLALINTTGLLEDLLELVSVDVAVQNLLAYLSRAEVAAAYQRIKAVEEVLALGQRLRELGVDVDTLLALVEAILGWGRKAVAPHADDLSLALAQLLENVDQEGLLALLPTLVESPEGQRVLEYLRGDDFAAILDALYAEPEFNNILNYLATNGLPDIYAAIEALHEAIGIDRSTKSVQPRELQDLIDQVLALINTTGLLEDLLELVSVDVAVQNLLAYLSRAEVAAAYQRIKAVEQVLALGQRLRELGVDVDTLLALVEAILGWGR